MAARKNVCAHFLWFAIKLFTEYTAFANRRGHITTSLLLELPANPCILPNQMSQQSHHLKFHLHMGQNAVTAGLYTATLAGGRK